MKIPKQLRLVIGKVLVITLGYVLINLLLYYLNYALIHSSYSLGPSDLFDTESYLFINILVGVMAGLLGGTSLVIVNGRYFRKRTFRFAMLTTAISYVTVFLIVNVVTILFSVKSQYEIINFSLFESELALAFDSLFLANFILWGVISLFTLFLIQVNDKFGPGILFKFIKGNYHQPRKEERIFMFMDMRSSTTIAEKIGNEQYFNLLNDVFADLTDTILNHEGEIYQYVGDEIVICWPMKRGIKNGNFVHCFMSVQQKLIALRRDYESKYGVAPEFKAGIHFGEVMAGEVGVIKKDIIYSGDVLNTTARIQEQCKYYQVDLLISKTAFDLLPSRNGFKLDHLGKIELRGKHTKVEIGTIVSNSLVP